MSDGRKTSPEQNQEYKNQGIFKSRYVALLQLSKNFDFHIVEMKGEGNFPNNLENY